MAAKIGCKVADGTAALGSTPNWLSASANTVPFPGVDRVGFSSVAVGDIVDTELFSEELWGSGAGPVLA